MARLITRRLLLGLALLAGLMRAATGAGQADAEGRAKGAAATPPAVAATEPARRELLVFAAASLSDALEEVGRAFTAATGVRVAASYAASSVLAKQIEAGAPADAFFSADVAWVDYLEKRGLIQPSSRRDVLRNMLVLIAPARSPRSPDVVALTSRARPEDGQLVEFLTGDAARHIFVRYGFTAPPGPRSGK